MRIAMLLPVADQPSTRAQALWIRCARDLSRAVASRQVELFDFDIHGLAQAHLTDCAGPLSLDGRMRLAHVFHRSADFDLIHDLTGGVALPYSPLVTTPVMATVWKEMWQTVPSFYQELDRHVFFLSPSEADRKTSLHYTDTVPWALNAQAVELGVERKEHLVFAGDVHDGEGLRAALELAERSGKSLCIIGRFGDADWLEQVVEPHRQAGRVLHVNDPASNDADRAVAEAAALVYAGAESGLQHLVVLDALLRGTPVVSLVGDRLPSVVREAETGFRCPNVESALAVVPKLSSLSRQSCRLLVERDHALDSVADKLVSIYQRVTKQTTREDRRPWGYYTVLSDEPDHKVKRIVVYPGKRLSLQRHQYRQEHWFMVDGEALVTRDEEEIRVLQGQSIEIPKGCLHRIRNPGSQNLTFIEVQTGEYFGEDDIERVEDDFGRV